MIIENQQMAFMEQVAGLFKGVRELKEICTKEDEHIHALEVTVEWWEVMVDKYAEIIEILQMRVHCNESIVRIVFERELRGESSELEFASETSKEEFTTLLPNLMIIIIEGCIPRGMFPVTMDLDADN